MGVFRKAVTAVFLLTLLPGTAGAQATHDLVPILGEFSNLPLSNKFGVPDASLMNESKDLAWIGRGGSAVFLKRSNWINPIRVIQVGDQIPGIANTRVLNVTGVLLNATARIAMRVDYATANRVSSAILIFNGSALQTIVTASDSAPNTGGGKFERALTLVAFNDLGDLLVTSTLVEFGSGGNPFHTVFFIPAGGAPVRVAGPGDAAPATGGTFTAAYSNALNNNRDVLVSASISGASANSALYVWNGGSFRKVVANGDPRPQPGGLVFNDGFSTPSRWLLNNAGTVVFAASSSIWVNTAGSGTVSGILAGSAAPGMGASATFSTPQFLPALTDAGDVLVQSLIINGNGGQAIYRYRIGVGLELVAHFTQTAPGLALPFQGFTAHSIGETGAVAFQGNNNGVPLGIFQKLPGQPLQLRVGHLSQGLDAGGIASLTGVRTRVQPDNSVLVRLTVSQGFATHAQVLFQTNGAQTTVMSTNDTLPFGARTIVRNTALSPAAERIGFLAQRAGGGYSAGVIDPGTQLSHIVATDGDIPVGSVLGRLLITSSTVFSNDNGQVAFEGLVLGSGLPYVRNAIMTASPTLPPTIVMEDGDFDNFAAQLEFPNLSGPGGGGPSPINNNGQIAFTAVVNGAPRGVFVGTAGGGDSLRVAVVGTGTSNGGIIQQTHTHHAGIASDGSVLFGASATTNPNGIFIGTPGSQPTKIAWAGDAAPGGGTFLSFGTVAQPYMRGSNRVVFAATTSQGPGGGIYMWEAGQPIVAIALNGQGAPGGAGLFVLTTAAADVTVNDQGDVLFYAGVSNIQADSGYFLRRFNSGGAIEPVVYEGQFAPGPGGVFMTFNRGPNQAGAFAQLSSTGEVAFFGRSKPNGTDEVAGYWHRKNTNQIEPILFAPSLVDSVGGMAATFSDSSSWMSNGRYPIWAGFNSGTTLDAILLYVPKSSAATVAGPNIQVNPTIASTGTAPVSVNFQNVITPGFTSVTASPPSPALPPNFRLGSPAITHNVTTTAQFNGTITVCINFTGTTFPAGASLRLFHYENGAWVDVTGGPPTGNTICGTVTSLSPFAVAQNLNVPASNLLQNGDFSNGTTGWSTFDGTVSFAVNGGVFEYSRPGATGVVLQETGAAVNAGSTLVASWDMGNTSSARKRFSVLIHNSFQFAGTDLDLAVCTFWLPPNTPMRRYSMRTHTTIAWQNATISIYAASGVTDAGVYQLDNVVLGPGSGTSALRTDCVDPGQPGQVGPYDEPSILENGDFSTGSLAPWNPVGLIDGTLTAQVVNGVARFGRPVVGPPTGVLLQQVAYPVAAGQIVTATFQLGNGNATRRRITILLHDISFSDLSACTFWLAPNQPLSTYTIRSYTTVPWANPTVSFYAATIDTAEAYRLDNVTLAVTPSTPTFGADCVEPGGQSGAPPPAPAPAPVPAPDPAPLNVTDAPAAESPWARLGWTIGPARAQSAGHGHPDPESLIRDRDGAAVSAAARPAHDPNTREPPARRARAAEPKRLAR